MGTRKGDSQPECAIEVRAEKTTEGHVGVGAMVVRGENVVWEESKYVGQGMCGHVGEYMGLLDAINAAQARGMHILVARVCSRVVSDQVNGFCKPQFANQWMLLNQVRSAMHNLPDFHVVCWPKGTSTSPVTRLAQAAILNHMAGASTSGERDNNEPSDTDSSNTIKRVKEENCLICREDKFSSEMTTIKICQHKFCAVCMQRHAEVQVQASRVPVRCPQEGCREMLELEECRQFLTPKLFNILSQRLMEANVPDEDKVYCPYPKCSTLMRKSGFDLPETSTGTSSSGSQKVDCVECKQNFCLDCRVPWHKFWTCQQYQALPPQLRDAEESNLSTLAESKNWQRCKKCRHLIELTEGCYHMTCRCGCEFCYTCGTEWKDKIQQCKCRLWDDRNLLRTYEISDDESDDDDDDDDDDEDREVADGVDFDDFVGDIIQRFEARTGVRLFRNRFFKTRLCRYYMRPGGCRFGRDCTFAHGEHELRRARGF